MASTTLSTLLTLLALHDWSNHRLWANASTPAVPRSSASAGAVSRRKEDAEKDKDTSPWCDALLEQSAKNQDPYVAASPLSVAAVCSDGIALVSLHYNVESEHSKHDDGDDDDDDGIHDSATSSNANGDKGESGIMKQIENNNSHDKRGDDGVSVVSSPHKFCDLPLSTRGPLRIESVYESESSASSTSTSPMSLLTAGWRTDGMALADAARELMMEEVRMYCLPSLAVMDDATDTMFKSMMDNNAGGGDNDNGEEKRLLEIGKQQPDVANIVVKRDTTTIQGQPYYGRRIAEGLSYYLAKCVFSGGVRSLSTVGLLACGGGSSDKIGGGASLYLIDATGTHRVRAHAIGNGSPALHRRMVFVDFENMDCHEGLRVLLRLIAEESGLSLLPSCSSTVPSSSGEKLKLDDVAEKKLLENNDGKNIQSLQDEISSSGGSHSMISKPAFVTKGNNGQPKNGNQSILSQRWIPTSNTAAELAVLKSGEGRMRRVRLSSLFPDNQQ